MEICHVCKKEKEPYTLVISNSILSYITYLDARKEGPICKRCNKYYGFTGEFKEPTDEELQLAQEAITFAKNVSRWWQEQRPNHCAKDDSFTEREWPGTRALFQWYRDNAQKKKNINTTAPMTPTGDSGDEEAEQ